MKSENQLRLSAGKSRHILLAGNNTVPAVMWHAGGKCFTECCLVNNQNVGRFPTWWPPAEYRWRPLRKFRNSIPCTTRQSLADPAAGVPCSNTANIGERKTWTQSEFCTWRNSVRRQEPPKVYRQGEMTSHIYGRNTIAILQVNTVVLCVVKQ